MLGLSVVHGVEDNVLTPTKMLLCPSTSSKGLLIDGSALVTPQSIPVCYQVNQCYEFLSSYITLGQIKSRIGYSFV